MKRIMTEHNLFDEVKEDLERQRLEALWKKYGIWVVLMALVAVLATAASTTYHSWQSEHNQKITTALLAAGKGEADPLKTVDNLQTFASENSGTKEASLALLHAGTSAADKGDKDKAIKIFDIVAHDDKADLAFRQLGDLLSVQLQMDSADPAVLIGRLQPLTEEHAPWRFSALETEGYLALRMGDKVKAKQIFTSLSQEASVPSTMASRASDILRSLN
jgi:hypothetical protein